MNQNQLAVRGLQKTNQELRIGYNMKKNNCNNGDKKQDIEIARLEERLSAANIAREIAVKDMERRLEGMNEFREQLNRQTQTFVTRETFEINHKELCKKLEELKEEVQRRPTWAITMLVAFTLSLMSFILVNYFVR
jgi:SMC interacting uncharacterized protein involved in chromosome segregation